MVVERDSLGFDAPAPVGHPARASMPSNTLTGPEVGSRLPDFQLPTSSGRLIDFHEDRGSAKAALVFYRSAVW
jgi:hypothetical protein